MIQTWNDSFSKEIETYAFVELFPVFISPCVRSSLILGIHTNLGLKFEKKYQKKIQEIIF